MNDTEQIASTGGALRSLELTSIRRTSDQLGYAPNGTDPLKATPIANLPSLNGSTPAATRTVALVDFFNWNEGGHFRMLFMLVAEALLTKGHRVLAVCRYPEEIEQWARENPLYTDRLKAAPCPNDEHAKQWWRTTFPREKALMPKAFGFRDRCRQRRHEEYYNSYFEIIGSQHAWSVDAIFYPSLTDYFEFPYAKLLWSHIPMAGLWLTAASYLNKGVAVSGRPLTNERMDLIRNQSSVHVLCLHDECLLDEYRHRFPKQEIVFWPDASDELPPNRDHPARAEILRRAAGRFIISSVGVFDRRKGIIPLLLAAEKLPHCFFVFAGPDVNPGSFQPDERAYVEKLLKNPPENCFFLIERIKDDRDFNTFVDVADILFIAYLGLSQSSNILTKAAVLKKPVIVSDRRGCLQVRASTYNLGIEIAEGCACCTVRGIEELRAQHVQGTLHEGRQYEEFMRHHSRAAMADKASEVVEKLVARTRGSKAAIR